MDNQKYDVDIILGNASGALNHVNLAYPDQSSAAALASIASSLLAMAVMLAERDGKKE